MQFILTLHAQKRCQKRHIRQEWIREALNNPSHTENDHNDPSLVHAFYPVPERAFKMLCVIYDETLDPVTIVTAFFDH